MPIKPRNDLRPDDVRTLLDYNPETGIFTWKERVALAPHDRTWNTRFAGKPAGTLTGCGYLIIQIYDLKYQAHRLAWLIMTGAWPAHQIDHINMQKDDNRFCNLREASNAENSRNSTKQKNNTSGFKGVYWNIKSNKWKAQIRVDNKYIYLGLFDAAEEAARAYARAAEHYHGEFARTE